MKSKVSNILNHIAKHGAVKIKMDRACGLSQIVVTKRKDGSFTVGKTPGSSLVSFQEPSVIDMLEKNSLFIISWGN